MTRLACFAVAVLALGPTSSRAAASPPTFTKDVAPILYNSCVSCHRPGEIAPMSLLTFDDVRPWAKSIRVKVASREMPPWGADPRFGIFKDDRSLSAGQIDTIARWVDAGAPRGSDSDLPLAPTLATGWSHGEPDVVIEMPVDFEIPAEGEVPVIDLFAKSPFTQDVYVKALEVRPGTSGVVHHAGLYVIDRLPDGAKLVNGQIVNADGKPMSRNQVARANGGSSTEEIQKLLSFVPGRGYEEYQGDAGQLIKLDPTSTSTCTISRTGCRAPTGRSSGCTSRRRAGRWRTRFITAWASPGRRRISWKARRSRAGARRAMREPTAPMVAKAARGFRRVRRTSTTGKS